jgi:dynein heavy chain
MFSPQIRDPPSEGMFVFGIYLWGVAWEKTTGELLDMPPKQPCASLPVIHLTVWPQGEKPTAGDSQKQSEVRV